MALGMKGLIMTINELVRELQKYDGNQKIVVCNYTFSNDDLEILDLRFFEPVIEVWDETIPVDGPENLVSINPGKLILG